jgi:hypothetical protein
VLMGIARQANRISQYKNTKRNYWIEMKYSTEKISQKIMK